MFRNLSTKVGALTVLSLPLLSHAAMDLSAVTDAGTEIAAVGAAVFVVMVGIKVIKWVRRAL